MSRQERVRHEQDQGDQGAPAPVPLDHPDQQQHRRADGGDDAEVLQAQAVEPAPGCIDPDQLYGDEEQPALDEAPADAA